LVAKAKHVLTLLPGTIRGATTSCQGGRARADGPTNAGADRIGATACRHREGDRVEADLRVRRTSPRRVIHKSGVAVARLSRSPSAPFFGSACEARGLLRSTPVTCTGSQPEASEFNEA